MAKSKKPKKKYRPREVFIPSILNAHFTFQPFEDALKRMLETGEMEIDEVGIPIYKDTYGKAQSFESGLKIYIRFISVYSECVQLNIDTKPFEVLMVALREGYVVEEENIEEVMACFKTCRELVAITAPRTMTLLMQQVRKEMNDEKIEEIARRNEIEYNEGTEHASA